MPILCVCLLLVGVFISVASEIYVPMRSSARPKSKSESPLHSLAPSSALVATTPRRHGFASLGKRGGTTPLYKGPLCLCFPRLPSCLFPSGTSSKFAYRPTLGCVGSVIYYPRRIPSYPIRLFGRRRRRAPVFPERGRERDREREGPDQTRPDQYCRLVPQEPWHLLLPINTVPWS